MTTKHQYEAVRDIATNLLSCRDMLPIMDGDLEGQFIDHLAEAMDIVLIDTLGWSAKQADSTSYEAIIDFCNERIEELNA